jgi:carboxyl-terminal processing protease
VKTRTALVALALFALLHIQASLPAAVSQAFPQQPAPAFGIRETAGTLFENVVAVLRKKYYDERFRVDELPKLAAQYAEKARRAITLGEQRSVIQEMLGHIPASHLGLLSAHSYRHVVYDLQSRAYPTFGFQLVEVKGKLYTFFLLEGGPAQRAGLLAWDRVVSIDGVPAEQSPRLDWRSDDAYISDERDPAVHYLIAQQGDAARFKIERRRGKFLDVTIKAENYSAFAAARASARTYQMDGRSIGYLHFWYIHIMGVPELLKEKLDGEFSNCDALILDLRGRGGNGLAIPKIIDILRAERSGKRRAVVALVDRQSRSAKDIIAYELKKNGLARVVGEQTAGAVIPATFADVGHDSVLMFPSFKLPRYTETLELKPVAPDLFVERAGPLSAGDDPILKAGLSEALRLVREPVRVARAATHSARAQAAVRLRPE